MEEPQIFTLDNAGPTPVSCTKLGGPIEVASH